MPRNDFATLSAGIIACEKCPRLRAHCTEIARVKKREFRDSDYWGKPVPGFGDPNARVLIIGLAPAAHGANRTGRIFTGDSSGSWLYRALYRAGFSNKPDTVRAGDGLKLTDVYISASCRCAPPENKPAPKEIKNCRPYLERELELLKNLRVVVCLGRIAFDNYRRILRAHGISTRDLQFGHGQIYNLNQSVPGDPSTTLGMPNEAPILIASYHPSRQNTNTGKLTEPMLDSIFIAARRFL